MKRSDKLSQRLSTIFAILILATLACSNIPLTRQTPPTEPERITLQTGATESLISATAGTEGGLLLVSAPGTPVDGFSIQIPQGAYTQPVPFDISMQPIEDHNLPENLVVFTPLIHVDNGEQWAQDYLEVSIPVQLQEDEFAMLFTYDDQTGKLDALPVLSIDETHLTALTVHFSDLLGVKINTSFLSDLNFQTGFRQGINNWQFTNYGSYIADGGHCAGQTIMAMDFFTRYPGDNLYGLYDNYNNDTDIFGKTPKNWYDDRAGYRLCSMAQNKMDWEGKSYNFWLKVQDNYFDWVTFYSLSLAMYASGEPQLVAIYNPTGGHAIIAYAKQGNRFMVSDPNYPAANANRSLQYRSWRGSFKPYQSGANADNLGEAFPYIRYINKYGLLTQAQLTSLWTTFRDGTIGQADYPSVKLTYYHEVAGESYNDLEVKSNLLFVDDERPDFFVDSSIPTLLLVYNKNNRQVGKSEGIDVLELDLDNPDGTPYLFSIFGKLGKKWSWIDGYWVNLVETYAGTWHSRSACDESESDPYKWQITLTQDQTGHITGNLSFHNCPGGGAAYYNLDGKFETGKTGVQLNGVLAGGRGDLLDIAPSNVIFTINRNKAPSPNYAP